MKNVLSRLRYGALAVLPFTLVSCASFQNHSVADYNGDGLISAAEESQYNRQRNIEDRNVYSESVKRRNVTNTARDVRDTVGAVRSTKWLLDSF